MAGQKVEALVGFRKRLFQSDCLVIHLIVVGLRAFGKARRR